MSQGWDHLYRLRRQVRDRHRSIWTVPLAKRASDLARRALAGVASPRALDVGANDRRLAEKLRLDHADVVYESVDPDPEFEHDYSDISQSPESSYDMVACFEVIEHVSLEGAMELLDTLRRRLRPGGSIVITTPNIFVPGQFHRDATHRTAFAYDELGGALLAVGFEMESLELFRVYNDGLLGKLAHRVLFYPWHRTLGVDFALSIAAVARRPAER